MALYFMLRGHAARLGFDGQSFDITVVPGPDFGQRSLRDGQSALQQGHRHSQQHRRLVGHVLGEGQEALLMPLEHLRSWLDGRSYRTLRTSGSDSNSRGLILPLADLACEKKNPPGAFADPRGIF